MKPDTYQRVNLPGSALPGHDRAYLDDVVFGPDFAGQTLLDIGSDVGHFCLEALKRGAAAATGIEADEDRVRKAREVAERLSLNPEYILADFESWDASDRAVDVVICLNVLHHMYDAVHSLRRMMSLCHRKLVIEFARPVFRDVRLGKISPLAVVSRGGSMVVLGSAGMSDLASRNFLFTEGAMKILINGHTPLFEPVVISRSPLKGRLIATAVRRRIGRLVILAGPVGSGSRETAARLQSDAGFRRELELDGHWLVDDADLLRLPAGPVERLILHYDLLRPYYTSVRSYERDPFLHVTEAADEVSVFTIVSPVDSLRERIAADAEDSGLKAKRLKEIKHRYADPLFVTECYRRWFSFLSTGEWSAHHHALIADGKKLEVTCTWADLL